MIVFNYLLNHVQHLQAHVHAPISIHERSCKLHTGACSVLAASKCSHPTKSRGRTGTLANAVAPQERQSAVPTLAGAGVWAPHSRLADR